MKRICLLMLALLVLSTCGRAGAEPVTTTVLTTTESESTTEEETTVFSGTSILMETDTVTVFETVTMWPPVNGFAGKFIGEIWLHNKATGKETLLLEPDYNNERDNVVPHFEGIVNDRYFVYYYWIDSTDAVGSPQFYDLEELCTVQVDYNGVYDPYFDHVAEGKIYINTWIEDDNDISRTYTIDIAALDSDGPITPKEVH